MYQEHFNLTREPFSIAPDPAFLYLSDSHNEALSHLIYGLSHGGFIMISGEVGTGKTTVLRNLLNSIPSKTDVAFILNPRLTAIELLETICEEFSLKEPDQPSQTIKQYINSLNKFLRENDNLDRSAVLIIDEAQNLSASVLEQIRLLTNIETDSKKLLRIILIGQPELEEMLSRTELRQLAQRITARYRLNPLNRGETKTYIQHRLQVAGTESIIFKDSAIDTVYKISKGIPRLINLLCDRAMLGAYALDLNEVSSSIIRQSREEVFGINQTNSRPNFSLTLFMIALVIAASTLFLYDYSELTLSLSSEKFGEGRDSAASSASHVQITDKHSMTPSWTSLKNELSKKKDGEQGRLAAYSQLFSIWGEIYEPTFSASPCNYAPNLGLRCFRSNGSWSDIANLNTPVILELGLDFNNLQYGLLKQKTNTNYLMWISAHELTVNKENLADSWFGSYEILWKPPPGYNESLSYGDEHTNIEWIKDLLAETNSYSFDPDQSNIYNQELLTIIEEFQQNNGLLVDGIIGPLTLIKLSHVLPGSAPKLAR